MKNRKEKIEALLSFYGTSMMAIKIGILDIMGRDLVNDVKFLKPKLLEELIKEIDKGIEITNVEEKLKALQVINEINERAMGTALAKADKEKRMEYIKDSEYLHDLTMDLQKMLFKENKQC